MRAMHLSTRSERAARSQARFSQLAGVLCCVVILTATREHVSAQGNNKTEKKAPSATKKEPAKQEAPSTKQVTSWPVKGRGRDQDDAERDALEKARTDVAKFLQRQNPPFVWTPAVDFIKKNLLAADPRAVPEEDLVIENQAEKVTMKCWEWTVQISGTLLQEMRQEDLRHRAELARLERHLRAEERMVALAKFTGWAVLTLAGVFLYLRVDQWTQGVHRGWLRVALWSVLGGSGIGWWLLS
jgi:hypothetical protein